MEKRNMPVRREADKAIKASEENYRLLVESSPYGWAYHKIIVDENNKPIDYMFLDINDAFEDLTGLKREDIVNKKVTEALPGIEKDPFDWIGTYGEVAQTGKGVRFENYSEALETWFSVTAFCPKKGYFTVVFDDITERKRMAKEIEDIFILSPDMLCVSNIEGKIMKVNPAWEKTLGYTSEEILELGWENLIHPDDIESVNMEIEKQMDGEAIIDYTNRYRCKDGTYKTFEWNALPSKNGMVYATARDVTDRKMVEDEIISISRFPAENPNPVVRIDNAYRILYRNSAFIKLFKEAGLSENDSLKILPDNIKAFVDQVLNTKQPVQYEEVTVGDKVISYNIIPVAEQGYVNLYGRDITERKKAEDELIARTAELERINRAFVGRELKMMDLKEEIKELKKKK